MDDNQRIEEAKKIIFGIFHDYEAKESLAISDEKYDEVRWLAEKARSNL